MQKKQEASNIELKTDPSFHIHKHNDSTKD